MPGRKTSESRKYRALIQQCRTRIGSLLKQCRQYATALPRIRHFVGQRDRLHRFFGNPRFEPRARRIHSTRCKQVDAFYEKSRSFSVEVTRAFEGLRGVLPDSEVEFLKRKVDPWLIRANVRCRSARSGKAGGVLGVRPFKQPSAGNCEPDSPLRRSKPQLRNRNVAVPIKIPDERKERALVAKRDGKSTKECAKILYATEYPTLQQVKNVYSHLRHYQRTHPHSEQ